MANILDYLDWRGDLTLAERPFGPVDGLLLAELCYLDFSSLVPGAFTAAGPTLQQAAEGYLHVRQDRDLGTLLPKDLPGLLDKMGRSPRFSQSRLCGYVSRTDARAETQFSALTTHLPDGSVFAAFRGTDDTIVGWKEDFNMAVLSTIPAQAEALDYFSALSASFPVQRLRLGGHSKGGNLAVYAAVYSPAAVQDRILEVYNYDGPGFHTSLLEMEQHRRIARRIQTIVPTSSVIGMLLEHEEAYAVVKSTGLGLFQHDAFSWQVMRDDFQYQPAADPAQSLTAQTMRKLIREMDAAQREAFVDALFEVLSSNNAETLTDLKKGGLKTASSMVKAYQNLDKDSRKALTETLKLLVKAGAHTVQDEIKDEFRERFPEEKKDRRPQI